MWYIRRKLVEPRSPREKCLISESSRSHVLSFFVHCRLQPARRITWIQLTETIPLMAKPYPGRPWLKSVPEHSLLAIKFYSREVAPGTSHFFTCSRPVRQETR